MSKTVMWFRKDLRFDDNTAFNELLKQSKLEEELMCIFQLNPAQFIEDSFNHKSFFKSVYAFVEAAKAKKIKIHFLYGDPKHSFLKLKETYPDWQTIYFNLDERGFGQVRDQKMLNFFNEKQIQVYTFQDSHLHGVKEIRKPNGENYKVFTPYFRQWLTKPKRSYEKTQKIEKSFSQLSHPIFEEGQQAFEQLINDSELPFEYDCGELVAERYLKEFIKEYLHDYGETRDYPALDQTSKLSRFLRTGELSIRKVWHAVNAEPDSNGRQTFISELCWRDFYNMIYFDHPQQKNEEIKEQYRQLQWNNSDYYFDCWKNGKTGYPLVDAAMRQLNQTGWMHNRLRMVVASFLTKDLLIDWRWGERYFQQQLIDYDPASNIGGWQWAASTGTDAVPYFRIFNPITQSERFDSRGDFIRQFIPELGNVPNKYIHMPSAMPNEIQQSSQCVIGKDYPEKIIDHSKIRLEVLSFFKEQS